MGWYGPDPPERARLAVPTVAATAAAEKPIDKMSVSELKAELTAVGLPDKGKKPELQEEVRKARTDLTAARLAYAPVLARRTLSAASPARASPRRRRGTATNERRAAVVLPVFGLPSPYRLPVSQRQKRRAPPTGQPKYTAARRQAAVQTRERGEEWQPIKRHQSEAAAEAAASEGDSDSDDDLDDDGSASDAECDASDGDASDEDA